MGRVHHAGLVMRFWKRSTRKDESTRALNGWGEIWRRADRASRIGKWVEAVAAWTELIALEEGAMLKKEEPAESKAGR